MKTFFRVLAVMVLFGGGYLTLAQTTKPSTQPIASAPINKGCPVVRGDAVDPTVFIIHEGKKVAFCCPDCMEEFRKDPAKYMKGIEDLK